MIRTLQSLRFFFIMLVVVSHYIGKSFDFGGECGVSFFFILSGFVLSVAYSGRISNGSFNTRQFVKKQWIKIYPLHIFTFIIMLILDLRLKVDYDLSVIIPNILLLQSWLPADKYYFVANGLSWFLCDILFFYIIFKSLNNYILNKLGNGRIIYIISVVFLLYMFLVTIISDSMINPILYANPLTRMLDFSIGIILYKIYISDIGQAMRNSIIKKSRLKVSFFEIIMMMSVFAIAIAYIYLPQRIRTVSLFWLVIPLFILFFAMSDKSNGVFTIMLQRKIMVWLGNISFELYIMHGPVLRIFNSISLQLGLKSGSIVHFTFFTLILITISYLTNVIMKHCTAAMKLSSR